MKNIAFWKIGALGDVLMTTPLVRQVRKAFPEAKIDYLVGRACAAMLEGNSHLDSVITFDETILYERKIAQLGSIVKLLRGYDVVFVLDKHWIFGLLAFCAQAPVRIGFARRSWEGVFHTQKLPYHKVEHEINYYLELGKTLGLSIDFSDISLELPESKSYLIEQPYIVLINGGGSNAYEQSAVRRMPPELFGELVQQCQVDGKVVFLGARDEWVEYEKFASERTINLCGKTSLQEAWHVLKHAQAVFSTDTGLMHMAGAVNSNLTAIFGPTHPLRKCPPGAQWIWDDEDIYDEAYELYGHIPNGRYFRKLSGAKILAVRRKTWQL